MLLVPEQATPRKVIYVAGYGRSGSTLLDVALGMHPDIIGAGELTALARHVWREREYCACCKPAPECNFWSRVLEGWQPDAEKRVSQLARLAFAQDRVEGVASPARLNGRGRAMTDFAWHTTPLLDRIAEVAGRPRAAILDSSKLPGRGLALAANPEIDLFVIHLIRDPRAVAWSLFKSYRRCKEQGLQKEIKSTPVSYTALRWSVVNLCAERLCSRVGKGRYVRLRYEDFCMDPDGVLARITDMAGLTPDPETQLSGILRPGHQIAGNRQRMKETLKIRIDGGWRLQMPEKQKRTVELLTGPLISRYRYTGGEDRDRKRTAGQGVEV